MKRFLNFQMVHDRFAEHVLALWGLMQISEQPLMNLLLGLDLYIFLGIHIYC